MPSQLRRPGRDGFSLVEMLIVIVLIGLMMLWAVPRAGSMLDHAQVRAARTAIANEFTVARNAARTSNRVAVLRLTGNLMLIEMNALSGTAKDTLAGAGGGKFLPLDVKYGVDVSGGADTLRIDPRGILTSALGTAVTYVVSRRGWRDSVVINSYGRITR
ncbi:MAG TPA: prepilin-type N-terminal cleavage/methylation domain-containing protein [Gemmatimonadales bacterium]|nr:prepilin-type N-terminal cleavage/methylation domain-containing protein [Gemmatimonadales bacterium]